MKRFVKEIFTRNFVQLPAIFHLIFQGYLYVRSYVQTLPARHQFEFVTSDVPKGEEDRPTNLIQNHYQPLLSGGRQFFEVKIRAEEDNNGFSVSPGSQTK